MIRMRIAPMLLVNLCVVQMLLISVIVTAQAPARSPSTSPATSPPAASPPAEASVPVVNTFPINTVFQLTAGNASKTIRHTAVVLTSPNGIYAMSLVMDGFGPVQEGETRDFCWTEVYNVRNPQQLTFRENCEPRRVERCSLSLTADGDLRLTLFSSGGTLTSWHTSTEDEGVTEAKLDDAGVLMLVKADGTVDWSSAKDDNDGCPTPFTGESSGALRFRVSKFLMIFSSALLSLVFLL